MRSIVVIKYILFAVMAFVSYGALAESSTALSGAPANGRAPSSASSESALTRIQRTGTLRVGIAVNAPWVVHDRQGQWIGMDVDLVRQLAEDMKWKIELVPTSWDHGMDELRSGRFDMLASGLSITPQRALSVRFSQPYGQFALGLVVNRKSVANEDLPALERGSKHRIAVLSDTITAATAKAWLGNNDVVYVNDENKAIADLRAGRLDGLLAEDPLASALAHTYPEQIRSIDVSDFGKTAHGFAVRKPDQDLVEVINAWLVYQQASGWIRHREDFWLHSPDWIELM